VRAPDVAFVSNERLAKVGMTKKFFPGAPDLAVEVVSPDDRPVDVHSKALQWLSSGASAVWVVDPAQRTVAVYQSATDIKTFSDFETFDGGNVLPGFTCNVRDILFSNPTP
jgi:Uma2 family endonuclease